MAGAYMFQLDNTKYSLSGIIQQTFVSISFLERIERKILQDITSVLPGDKTNVHPNTIIWFYYVTICSLRSKTTRPKIKLVI